jgi:hypothetical protein
VRSGRPARTLECGPRKPALSTQHCRPPPRTTFNLADVVMTAGKVTTRRSFVVRAGALTAAVALSACSGVNMDRPRETSLNFAALSARPGKEPASTPVPGQHALGLESARDTLLYVPAGIGPDSRPRLFFCYTAPGGSSRRPRAAVRSCRDAQDRPGSTVVANLNLGWCAWSLRPRCRGD